MNTCGYLSMDAAFRAEAGVIPDHDALMLQILLLDLQKEGFGPVHIHGWNIQEHRLAVDHLDRSVAIAPPSTKSIPS